MFSVPIEGVTTSGVIVVLCDFRRAGHYCHVLLGSCLHIPITDYYAELLRTLMPPCTFCTVCTSVVLVAHKGHLVVIYNCVILTMTNK